MLIVSVPVKRALLIFLTLVIVVASPIAAFGQMKSGLANALQGDAFADRPDISAEAEAELTSTLAELAVEHGFTADMQAMHRAAVNTNVLVIPLQSAALDARDTLALLYDASKGDRYFLLLDDDPILGGVVKLWGDGPSEIIIDAQGIYYSPYATETTFRLRDSASSTAEGKIAANGLADNIQCLAAMFGLTFNPQSLTSLLSSITCQTLKGADDFKRAVQDLILIAGHCFSAINCAGLCPVSTTFCLTGLAKWITCGYAECYNGPSAPPVPGLSSPANGATVSGSTVTLSINAVSGATKYNTQVGIDPTFPPATTATSGDHGTSVTWNGLPNNGRRFYWRARACNNSGCSAWSPYRYFISGSATTSVPAPPTLLSPANGARVSGSNVTLFWNPSAGATKYQTQVSTSSSFSSPFTGYEQTGTSTTWSGFSNNGQRWYWRVRAGNDKGWSQWSSARSFLNY